MTNTEALNEAINEKQRQETEKKILDLLAEIRDIYHEYCPEGNYLHICILDGNIDVNNDYFKGGNVKPINASLDDGRIYRSDFMVFDKKYEKEDEDDD